MSVSIYDTMAWWILDNISQCGIDWGYVMPGYEEDYAVLDECGYLSLDPTGSIYLLTEFGSYHCEEIQYSWLESDRNWKERKRVWMSKRAYARHRRCAESTVRAACKGRLSLALVEGVIDRELADALWVCSKRRVKTLPAARRKIGRNSNRINHDRALDPYSAENRRAEDALRVV